MFRLLHTHCVHCDLIHSGDVATQNCVTRPVATCENYMYMYTHTHTHTYLLHGAESFLRS